MVKPPARGTAQHASPAAEVQDTDPGISADDSSKEDHVSSDESGGDEGNDAEEGEVVVVAGQTDWEQLPAPQQVLKLARHVM